MSLTRCFIALDLSREAINEIKNIQKVIGKKFLFTGKFTEPENFHLTLKFLGEINDEQIEKVKKILAEIQYTVFTANLGVAGVFSKKIPKILWIALHGAYDLQKVVDNSLRELFPIEERFMGHITLARIKYISEKKALTEYIQNLHGQSTFLVNKFYLKKSELKSEGPIYYDLATYSLMDKISK
ncbi:RNA 2',3'-cyclic phosphodiesterase [Candidatus Pacearchaeota archaeon]|nr:RNA 2',3'-cyclic phosphodiesterase [Candidatus Pacearchaeota archaeon]